MEKIDNCRNCLFYKPHYAKNDEGEMYKLDTGRCEHPNIHIMQFRRSIKTTGHAIIGKRQRTKPPKKV